VATATFARARSDINRIDGAQVVSISAKPVDESVDVVASRATSPPSSTLMLNQHPDLSWRYTGYVAEHEETKKRAIIGGIALFLALYALLAIPVPFALSAVLRDARRAIRRDRRAVRPYHLDITPSYLSVFGILALAGVVVNDSLVMVDFINQKTRAGEDLFESVIHSGTRASGRFSSPPSPPSPGLLPILFDRSLQAQFLIPMAASLAFGILFATAITLYLILVLETLRRRYVARKVKYFAEERSNRA
jgi:multidrug efflux pump subunit AcrB